MIAIGEHKDSDLDSDGDYVNVKMDEPLMSKEGTADSKHSTAVPKTPLVPTVPVPAAATETVLVSEGHSGQLLKDHQCPGVLWRINAGQCDYSKLGLRATFSTAALNPERAGLGPGSCLIAMSSGTVRPSILGLWTIESMRLRKCKSNNDIVLDSFFEPYKTRRRAKQWRVTCRRSFMTADIKVDQFMQLLSKHRRSRRPVPLTETEFDALFEP